MSISNVVAPVIDAHAEMSVYSLECGIHVFPCVITVDYSGGRMMLEVSNSHQPPTEHKNGSSVIKHEVVEITAHLVDAKDIEENHSGADDSSHILGSWAILPHSSIGVRNEMGSIGKSREVERPSDVREDGHKPGVAVEESGHALIRSGHHLRSIPLMRVVLVLVVVVHVVAVVGQTPWPVGHQDGTMSQVSDDVVHPLIIRERSMPTIVTDNLTNKALYKLCFVCHYTNKKSPHEKSSEIEINEAGESLSPERHCLPSVRVH